MEILSSTLSDECWIGFPSVSMSKSIGIDRRTTTVEKEHLRAVGWNDCILDSLMTRFDFILFDRSWDWLDDKLPFFTLIVDLARQFTIHRTVYNALF